MKNLNLTLEERELAEDFLLQRILPNIEINEETGCWQWQRAKHRNDYGKITYNKRTEMVHRLVYKVLNNMPDLDSKTVVCHSCDEPTCCNPEHLWTGTQKDNIHDMHSKGRGSFSLTHCIRGHEFTEENTSYFSTGKRGCKECNRLRQSTPEAKLKSKLWKQQKRKQKRNENE